MNEVEKCVREAMPIQEEERASGNRCKGDQYNKQLELDSEKIQGPLLLPDVKIH